jgi:hypothetical protein
MGKLIDVLNAQIEKDEKSLSREQAAKAVKIAQRDMSQELSNCDLALDDAKDNLTAVDNNPRSTARDILNAQRNLAVAEADYKAIKKIYEGRF